jgi:hypothetical protein
MKYLPPEGPIPGPAVGLRKQPSNAFGSFVLSILSSAERASMVKCFTILSGASENWVEEDNSDSIRRQIRELHSSHRLRPVWEKCSLACERVEPKYFNYDSAHVELYAALCLPNVRKLHFVGYGAPTPWDLLDAILESLHIDSFSGAESPLWPKLEEVFIQGTCLLTEAGCTMPSY